MYPNLIANLKSEVDLQSTLNLLAHLTIKDACVNVDSIVSVCNNTVVLQGNELTLVKNKEENATIDLSDNDSNSIYSTDSTITLD